MIETKDGSKERTKLAGKASAPITHHDRMARAGSQRPRSTATSSSPSHDMPRTREPKVGDAPQRPSAPRFVCLAEIARRWRVHRSTARRILDRGRVLPYALGGERGGTIRYDLNEILAFEKKSRERSS